MQRTLKRQIHAGPSFRGDVNEASPGWNGEMKMMRLQSHRDYKGLRPLVFSSREMNPASAFGIRDVFVQAAFAKAEFKLAEAIVQLATKLTSGEFLVSFSVSLQTT